MIFRIIHTTTIPTSSTPNWETTQSSHYIYFGASSSLLKLFHTCSLRYVTSSKRFFAHFLIWKPGKLFKTFLQNVFPCVKYLWFYKQFHIKSQRVYRAIKVFIVKKLASNFNHKSILWDNWFVKKFYAEDSMVWAWLKQLLKIKVFFSFRIYFYIPKHWKSCIFMNKFVFQVLNIIIINKIRKSALFRLQFQTSSEKRINHDNMLNIVTCKHFNVISF